MKTTIRTILAVVLGYAVMVMLIILVQEVWLGGVSWGETPLPTLALAGLLTMLCGFLGAIVATVVAGGKRYTAALAMAVLVMVEMTYLIVTGIVTGPLWFDIAAGLSLAAAILAGGWFWCAYRRSNERETVPA